MSSVEAFALALVEASSRLEGADGTEPAAHTSPRDEDGPPAAE
jgi:hypothetical protein